MKPGASASHLARAAESSLRIPPPRVWYGELHEIGLALLVTFAYFLTRGLARGSVEDAIQHADGLLALERTLQFSPERALQRFGFLHPRLLEAANIFYLAGHLPVLIAVAVWLYWKHPRDYRLFRTAFLISAVIGLCVYISFPVAPPRYLPGFVDTLKVSGLDLDGSATGLFYNPYAAMPSLHVGWALLAGTALAWHARAWWLKVIGAALPVAMTCVVLMTANHYLLDVLAGMLVALVSLGLALLLRAWRAQRILQAAHRMLAAALSPEPVGASHPAALQAPTSGGDVPSSAAANAPDAPDAPDAPVEVPAASRYRPPTSTP
jgi:membrane-associated phospholipid phosphatase